MANKTKDRKGSIIDVQPLRSSEEISEFRDALKVAGKTARGDFSNRNLLLFNIGVNTGLRIGDIVQLRIEDVKGKSKMKISEGKTKKVRTVELGAIMGDIADYLEDEPNEGYLFPSRSGEKPITTTQAYRILTKASDLIGRNDIGTHTLRKTFGYHYYRLNKDVATLMEIFNHSDQATTKRYIGIREDEIAASLKDFRI
ncbi:site-specific integrase [Salipaludibacillus neizhouensis]|uniref:Site-specific integrase n=1 Tax=Salipaludibacillus neizhouensis TaxID=885475 RepID=A0A3A9KMM8_9BACI|nr:tyrosine-type recombinase/integrase [Salipaludibacillus neizhouensis]RKL69155.1 site-specific integrase [Salipaludibacillus neizhouensis]